MGCVNLLVSFSAGQRWSGGTFSKSQHCQSEFNPRIVHVLKSSLLAIHLPIARFLTKTQLPILILILILHKIVTVRS